MLFMPHFPVSSFLTTILDQVQVMLPSSQKSAQIPAASLPIAGHGFWFGV
jgi:hypothetical protein